jgi:hypothetical protein
MSRAWTHYSRGEDLAVIAMRFLGDSTTREIGAAIGRSQNSVSERMTKLGMRLTGGREWAWKFLTNGHRI